MTIHDIMPLQGFLFLSHIWTYEKSNVTCNTANRHFILPASAKQVGMNPEVMDAGRWPD